MTLVFTLALLLYYESQLDVASLSAYSDSHGICRQIATHLSAVQAAGSGMEAVLRRPMAVSGGNYTVFVSGPNRSISVSYGGQGAGCSLALSNITNGSSASFYIEGDVRVRNVDGGVVVG